MVITRSIDIEDAVRLALSDYMTTYCRPLPASFTVPSILVTETGGDSEGTATGKGKVDTFVVVLDSRAETEAEALENLRTAVGILEATKTKGFGHVEVNSLYSWGVDPVRPDLAMCSATIMITAHRETITLT